VADTVASLLGIRAGLSLAAAVPRGGFGENFDAGAALVGDVTARVLPIEWLTLRLDGGAVLWESETTERTLYYRDVPIPIQASTDTWVFQGAIGPQLYAPGVSFRPHLYGLVGLSYFETSTSVDLDAEHMDDREESIHIDSEVHVSDWTPSFVIGGGFEIPLSAGDDGTIISLGLGAEYRTHGTTRYVPADDVRDVNGRAEYTPVSSRADFFLLKVGVTATSW
jgi:hypothetical protein